MHMLYKMKYLLLFPPILNFDTILHTQNVLLIFGFFFLAFVSKRAGSECQIEMAEWQKTAC